MIILLVVAPVLQLYVPPPDAERVSELPTQIEVFPLKFITGAGLMVILTCRVTETMVSHAVSVNETVYEPELLYTTEGFCKLEEDGLPPGKDQVHEEE